MVQYKDGSVLAQLGNPDMCTPLPTLWPIRNGSSPVWNLWISSVSESSALSGPTMSAIPVWRWP